MIKHIVIAMLTVTTSVFAQKTVEISYDFNLNFGEYRVYSSTLFVSPGESLFMWGTPHIQTVEDTDTEFSINMSEKDSIGNYNYIDMVADTLYSRQMTFNTGVVIVREIVPKIAWKILEEVKNIGPLSCQKAEASFRGRTYTAWFAREIPIRSGPWKLQGLPGLIVMAYDDTGEVRFVFKSLTQTDEFVKPNFPDIPVFTLEEYKVNTTSGAKDLLRQLSSKMPREMSITLSKPLSLEYFD